jgi:hypothetical protein
MMNTDLRANADWKKQSGKERRSDRRKRELVFSIGSARVSREVKRRQRMEHLPLTKLVQLRRRVWRRIKQATQRRDCALSAGYEYSLHELDRQLVTLMEDAKTLEASIEARAGQPVKHPEKFLSRAARERAGLQHC